MPNRKIRIFFDANPLIVPTKSGVGYYTHFLIANLASQYPDQIELVGHYFNFLGRKHIAPLPTAPNISYRPSHLLPAKMYLALRRLHIGVPVEILGKQRFDFALFANYFTAPSLFGAKIIVTVHDLTYKLFPQFMESRNLSGLKAQIPLSIRRSSLVLAVSETLKQELMREFSLEADKVVVTYPLYDLPPVTDVAAPTQRLEYLKDTKFFLFVSTLEPRKNILTLVNAYAALPQDIQQSHALVLAGGTGWNSEELLQRIETLRKQGLNIQTLGYVVENEKDFLYQNAALFVMPSHYEGFGMPIIEALKYQRHCVVSDIPVFREVAGSDGITFYSPADDTAQLKEALLHGLSAKDSAIPASVVESIEQRFSWSKSIDRLYAAMQKLRAS